jgi:hypothetical protein
MGTTATWLQSQEYGDVAFVLAFEGLDILLTTTSDTSGILTAWTGTDWTACYSGLEIVGEVGQEVELFEGTIRDNSLTFSAVDHGDYLLAFFKDALSTANRAFLNGDLDSNDTTVTVLTTNAAWSTTANLYFGSSETATASAKPNSTTFTVTRGKWALHGTSSSSTRFGRPHVANTDGTMFSPVVSDVAQTHYNRNVAVYLHHRVDGAWSTKANAELIWAGRIKGYGENGEGRVSWQCRSVHDMLAKRLLADQFTAEAADGIILTGQFADIGVQSMKLPTGGATDVKADVLSTLDSVGTLIELDDLLADINTELQIWSEAGDVYGEWSVGWTATDGGERIQFRAYISGAGGFDSYQLRVSLSPWVWAYLGFVKPTTTWTDSNGYAMATLTLERVNTTTYVLTAPNPPRVFQGYASTLLELEPTSVRGSFAVQDTPPSWAPPNTEAFILVAGRVLAVERQSPPFVTTLRILGDVTERIGYLIPGSDSGGLASDVLNSVETSSAPVEIKQVWIDEANGYDMWSKLLLSTGTSAHNHATKDVFPRTLSVGIPYTLLDLDSLFVWRRYRYLLFLDKPASAMELLEKWLQFTGCYLVWSGGKLTVQGMGTIGPAASAVVAFTDDNCAQVDDVPGTSRSVSGVVNRVILKYKRKLDGSFADTITVNNLASQSDFGLTSGGTIEAPGVYRAEDVAAWTERVSSTVLAYFGRPVATVERTYDFSLETRFVPGDLATLTAQRVIDPRTGTRGVTEMPCWVLAKSFNWTTGVGRVTLAFSPELDSTKVPAWAPSALVTGYVDGTKTLTCSAHQFSGASDAADASYLPAGSKVHIYKLDVASPTEYFDTVASQTGNTIVLTAGLGGAIPAGSFVVESDDATTATATQFTRYAYIADDADYSTDRGANDYKLYGSSSAPVSTTVDFTQYYVTPSTTADDVGEPLSAHKFYLAVNWLNSALSNATRVTLADTFTTEVSVEGENFNLAYGPVFVPMFGGNRTMNVAIQGYVTAGTATFRIVLSGVMVGGTALTPTYGDGGTTRTDLTTTGTTLRTVEGAILFPNRLTTFEGVPGAWLTVEAKTSTQIDFAKLRGITVSEATLS